MALEPIRAPSAAAGDEPASRADSLDARDAFGGHGDLAALPRYSTDRARVRVLHQGTVAPAWVDGEGVIRAVLYTDEVAALAAAEPGTFTTKGDEGLAFDVRVAARDPTPWDRSTMEVRLDAVGRAPRPLLVGAVRFAPRDRRALVVPAASVLASKTGAYVLVADKTEGRFVKRSVITGRSFAGFVGIARGLAPDESVVSINAFFLDAERRAHEDDGAVQGDEP